MKNNGNDKIVKDYYIGLDIGTDSIGWAAVNQDYTLCRICGKDAWGIRLFDEGNTAVDRRLHRTGRRRLQRRNWRIELLKQLFDEELCKVDSGFLQRTMESSLLAEDKSEDCKFSLFADKNYTDKDYHKAYPSVYHLRYELFKSKEPHDIRLVYLAILHILKSRGHFIADLSDTSDADSSLETVLETFAQTLKDSLGIVLTYDAQEICDVLHTKRMSKTDKFRSLKDRISVSAEESDDENWDIGKVRKNAELMMKLIVGMKVSLDAVFDLEDKLDITLSDGSEENFEKALGMLDDRGVDVLSAAKNVYDKVIIDDIMRDCSCISEHKVKQYNEHKHDIKVLKEYVKTVLCDDALYKEIFNTKQNGLNNYAAYSGYEFADLEKKISCEDFCKYLRSRIGTLQDGLDNKFYEMKRKIDENEFAVKLRTSENGKIPNGLHKAELIRILENASTYLPFLNATDESGLSVKEKIVSIFEYKLPYYVGPLNSSSERSWVVRKDGMEGEKILPWNIGEIVDYEASSEAFITRMTSLCTYTAEPVLPFDSLLYKEFTVLNEINNIKVNGIPISVHAKNMIFENLFVKKNKKVTKKAILDFLVSEGLAKSDDNIDGVDGTLTSNLSSYHALKNIIAKTSVDTAEKIIRRIVLFGDEKKVLKNWLKNNTSLNDEDIKYCASLKFKNWGRFSRKFLTGIEAVDTLSGTGELVSIMDMLKSTNLNLMKLLSGDFDFASKARELKSQKLGVTSPKSMVDDLYVSPKIRRAIWQTLRIVDEVVDAMGGAPKKIFIEMARSNSDDKKGKRTKTRKEKLMALYSFCSKCANDLYQESRDLHQKIENESDASLRRKKLYLYYMQFGKCMYSGEKIELEQLYKNNLYDIDHIYPRSKVKDDSFDNLVLVKAQLNRDKDNEVLPNEIRNKMKGFWHQLYAIDAISKSKLDKLMRTQPFSEDELRGFINRQIVETTQSTKAVAELLQCLYQGDGNVKTKIVYSKAGNVSDFRQQFNMLKCRAVNDLHHAKDAYLNVVVGNFYDTKFSMGFLKGILANQDKYTMNPEKMFNHDVPGAWTAGDDGSLSTVRKIMRKNSVLYTRLPHEGKGKLFDVQPVKKGLGQLSLKKGRDIAKYGGYTGFTSAYWALVEYKKRNSVERSLEVVTLCDKVEYEKDPQAYAKKKWANLGNNVRVVIPKIMVESLLEINGLRIHVKGKSDNSLIFTHTKQLYLTYEQELMIRDISKYVERCKNENRGQALPIGEDDGISRDNNIYLYKLLIDKFSRAGYDLLPAMPSVLSNIVAPEQSFINADIYVQCKIIMECLNAFRCHSVKINLKEIGGASKIGPLRVNKKVSSLNTAYLVHQSVTGLYEQKEDLLK